MKKTVVSKVGKI